MIERFEPRALAVVAGHGYDTVIDVRSPAEYAEDHLPGAINLPVLEDDERARVGTIYKQVEPFAARKLGAALVARNAARHLEGPLAAMPGGWRPLIYCWRGGQRSGSFATILAQIGWRVAVLDGGYRTYRRLVVAAMHERPLPFRLVLLDGYTGTGKTDLLHRLGRTGVQVLDLEALANHRGSVFGRMSGGQPSQKAFEGAVAMALAGMDPARPVLVEAESALIGNLRVPARLWKAMRAAPRIELTAPLSARVARALRDHAEATGDPALLHRLVEGLRPLHPRDVVDGWSAMAAEGRLPDLAADLMQRHYDPRYARSRSGAAPPIAVIDTGPEPGRGMDAAALAAVAVLADL
ncbi:MAG: tRNA 2-selenouridine(34) synthase MnmH [Gemmobacter sp.]